MLDEKSKIPNNMVIQLQLYKLCICANKKLGKQLCSANKKASCDLGEAGSDKEFGGEVPLVV